MSDPANFTYVDTAFGGVNHRNRVQRLEDVRLNGQADCYVSHNRATVTLLEWRNTHKNERGKPTVAGFTGPTWADNLHLDYDCEADPGQALVWCRQGLDWLEAHGVELRAVRVYFSGQKGFGVEIPHTLFGGFAPSENLHQRLRRAALAILKGVPFDTSIYDKLRLWRLPNTRHGKSGLYKIRLTVAEIRTLGIDEIRALAAAPRDELVIPDLAPIADDEWSPNETLVGIWEATAAPDSERANEAGERQAPTDAALDHQTVAAIAASWPHGGKNEVEGEGNMVSRHADYLMPIVGFLAARTAADHVIELVAAAAVQANDRTFVVGRDWRGEIKRMVGSATERIGRGDEVKGLPSLAKTFPALARVLEALWPDPVFTVGGTEDPASTADPAESRYWAKRVGEIVASATTEDIWTVDGIVPHRRVTWLFSDPAAGKSMIVLALLLHIAAGRPFCGRPVRQGPVLMIEEDSSLSVITSYIQDLADIYEIDLGAIPFWMNGISGLRLTSNEAARPLLDIIAEMDRAGERPVVVALDACERLVPSDRFSTKEIEPLTRFIQWCLSEAIAILVVDHTNKEVPKRDTPKADPMTRLYGARAKAAIADVMLYIKGTIGTKAELQFVKFRGEAPPNVSLTYSRIDGFTLKVDPVTFRTDNERQVMQFFNNNPGEWYLVSQIEASVEMPERSLRRVLARFVERHIVLVRGQTHQRLYRRSPGVDFGHGGVGFGPATP